MTPDFISRQVVNSTLRLNLPLFATACVILLCGVCSLALVRLRSRDRLLLWVGAFSILYSARLFVQNELVRDAFNRPGKEYIPWALCITYLINVPFALFARELLGRGWKGSVAIGLRLCVAFAVLAIPTIFVPYKLSWVGSLNDLLVVGLTVLMLLRAIAERRARNSLAASLFWPLLIFGFFVLLENTGVTVGGRSVEPIGFLILLGGLASIALRRALATERKLLDVEQELSTARRIQNAIIPQAPPTLNGIRIATRYQPMTSVSGHGVPAALVACMLKVCFEAQKNNAADPAAILSGISLMLRASLGGQYVTTACAVIDRNASTVTYAGAGHPPTLLARGRTGDLVLLAENGLIIGPFPKATYVNVSVPFHLGDKLLLYTDGITEANDSAGEEFGRESLGRFLLRSSESEPAVVLDRLFAQITTGSQQDDLTAVLVYLE